MMKFIAGLVLVAAGASACEDNRWWRDQDGDGCIVYRQHPRGATWACKQPGYEAALTQCPQTCGMCGVSAPPLILPYPPAVPVPARCERYTNDCYGCTKNGCYYEQSSGRCGESSRCDFFKAEDPKMRAGFGASAAHRRATVCVQTPEQCSTGFGTCEWATNAWDCNQSTRGLDCEWTRWGCRARLEVDPNAGAGSADCLTHTAVRGYNMRELQGYSREECVRACRNERSCYSVEHHPRTQQCVLSSATRSTPTIRSDRGWTLCYVDRMF